MTMEWKIDMCWLPHEYEHKSTDDDADDDDADDLCKGFRG